MRAERLDESTGRSGKSGNDGLGLSDLAGFSNLVADDRWLKPCQFGLAHELSGGVDDDLEHTLFVVVADNHGKVARRGGCLFGLWNPQFDSVYTASLRQFVAQELQSGVPGGAFFRVCYRTNRIAK